jgi:hypothetical protein
MRLRNLVIVVCVLMLSGCASISPSLQGATTDVISSRYGDITVLQKQGDYQLIKVVIPGRLDKVCIVRGDTVIDEYSTQKTDAALQTFQDLTRIK